MLSRNTHNHSVLKLPQGCQFQFLLLVMGFWFVFHLESYSLHMEQRARTSTISNKNSKELPANVNRAFHLES